MPSSLAKLPKPAHQAQPTAVLAALRPALPSQPFLANHFILNQCLPLLS